MSLRSEVGAILRTHLVDWDGHDYGLQLTGVTRRTFMLEQHKVEPGASAGLRTITLAVHVIVPGEDLAKVEDELEAALDELLLALDHVPHVLVLAERGVVNGSTLNAYTVTVEVPARKE